jgi:hypothetical protein
LREVDGRWSVTPQAELDAEFKNRQKVFASLRRGAAVLVRATSAEIRGTYLLVNNGNLRLDPANDLMLRLTGSSGRLPAVGAIDPAAVFG